MIRKLMGQSKVKWLMIKSNREILSEATVIRGFTHFLRFMETEQSREAFLQNRLDTYLKPLLRELQKLIPKNKDATLPLVDPEMLTTEEVIMWDTYVEYLKRFADILTKLQHDTGAVEPLIEQLREQKKALMPSKEEREAHEQWAFSSIVEKRKLELDDKAQTGGKLDGRTNFHNWLNNRLGPLAGNVGFFVDESKGGALSQIAQEELPIIMEEIESERQLTDLQFVQEQLENK